MAHKLVIVVALYYLVQVINSKAYIVQAECRSYSNSCRTLSDYANKADSYFTSNSFFHFRKGKHHLNVTLFITNVFNLSFVGGDKNNVVLSNGCSIIWTKSSILNWTSLNVTFNETNDRANNSAISFSNSELVTFKKTSFIKLP